MPQSDYWPFSKTKQIEDVDYNCQAKLQKQLGDMEGEVKFIQMELAEIRRQRRDAFPIKEPGDFSTDTKPFHEHISKIPDFSPYNKEDTEINKLREELIRAKTSAEEERFQRLKYEGRLKDLELKINNICGIGQTSDNIKESRKITEDEVVALKMQIRDMKEQLEEMNITVDEKTEQLQEYRVKYLQAQQQVEELKTRLNVMEYDNKQASEQIQIELQKMKNTEWNPPVVVGNAKMQFQEKLLELAPLPDLLKGAQIQLQEAKQLQKLAEDSAQQISNELHRVKEKLVIAVNSLNQEKLENSRLSEECSAQRIELDDKHRETDEMTHLIDDYKCKVVRLEEKLTQLQIRYDEKALELIQLTKDLEELKEETGRSMSRAKERAESTRHHLQTQIAGLERQLISCRAQCKAYQKERDDIRQRVQIQIHSLKECFEMVESRLQGLQSQIAFLKHYCYTVSLPENMEDNVDRDITNSCNN